MSKKRTYPESYVDFGFDFIIKDNVKEPQFIFSSKVLGNGFMKPSILEFILLHAIPHMFVTTLGFCWLNVLHSVLQEHCKV